MSFNSVTDFETAIADFFGAPHAVAVDCCTHGIELCLRHQNIKHYSVPKRTYSDTEKNHKFCKTTLLGNKGQIQEMTVGC